MADDPTPHWQPLTTLPLIASLIDGERADGQEHHATLLSVRDRPHVLDDATVERSIKLHTEQRDFLGVFAEQLVLCFRRNQNFPGRFIVVNRPWE